MKTREFRLRVEELPALGEFVESSFLRDKDLFAAFSPVYANGFAEAYRSKLEEIKVVAAPQVVTGKRKRITENLYATHKSMRLIMEDIVRYCRMAEDKLSYKTDDLGLRGFRKSLNSHNSEASIQRARTIQQIIAPDIAMLEEKGYTPEKQTELKTLIDTVENLNLEQNTLLNERKQLVESNKLQLNEFWKLVKDLMQTGQIIHRDNPVRKEEYTEKNLMSRVRLMLPPKKRQVEEVKQIPETPAEQPVESPPLAA
jgi:hypothetical protein